MAALSTTNFIFGGGDHPWNETGFTAVDDSVRGGTSFSHLTVGSSPSDPARTAATFWGYLDTSTLGGAGFASQRTVDPYLCDLQGVDALVAEVVLGVPGATPNKTFTVTLKNDILPPLPDGREQSTVSWEYDFSVLSGEHKGSGQDENKGQVETRRIEMPLAEFKPTYRGRAVEDGSAKLDLANIKRISFMMRSFFDQQQGNFSLTFNWISASKTSGAKSAILSRDDASSADGSEADEKPAPGLKPRSGLLGWLCSWAR